MELEVTLNGVKMKGTADQLAEVARKLGVSLGDDGVFYMSSSRGLMRISDMDENHVKNAVAKRYRTHFEGLKNLEEQAFTKALQGPQDKTTVALVARLVQLNYEKARRVPSCQTYR